MGHVVGDDPGGLATLAAAGAVAEEEAAAQLEGAFNALLHQHQLVRCFAQHPPARQKSRLRLASVDHGLDLSVGQQPLLHDVGRQERAIGRGRRRHRRHGAGFHQRGGVWTAPLQGQAADPVGLVEADVVALARPSDCLERHRRGPGQEPQAGRRRGQGAGARSQEGDVGDRPELARLGGRARVQRGGQLGDIGQRLAADDLDGAADAAVFDAVQHQQAGLDRGPVLGIGAGREGDQRHHPAAAGERLHRPSVLEEARGYDGAEPPALRKAVDGGVEVTLQPLERRIGDHGLEAA